MRVFDRFARAAVAVGRLRIVLPSGAELAYGDEATTDPAVAAGGPAPPPPGRRRSPATCTHCGSADSGSCLVLPAALE